MQGRRPQREARPGVTKLGPASMGLSRTELPAAAAAAAAAIVLAACVRASHARACDSATSSGSTDGNSGPATSGGGSSSTTAADASGSGDGDAAGIDAPDSAEDQRERAAWRYIVEAAALIEAAGAAADGAQLALALRRCSSALRLVPQQGTGAHAVALWHRSVAFDLLGERNPKVAHAISNSPVHRPVSHTLVCGRKAATS